MARASGTCRDACWDRYPVMAGKTFPAFLSRRMCNRQFYVSGKRPMLWNVFIARIVVMGITMSSLVLGNHVHVMPINPN